MVADSAPVHAMWTRRAGLTRRLTATVPGRCRVITGVWFTGAWYTDCTVIEKAASVAVAVPSDAAIATLEWVPADVGVPLSRPEAVLNVAQPGLFAIAKLEGLPIRVRRRRREVIGLTHCHRRGRCARDGRRTIDDRRG